MISKWVVKDAYEKVKANQGAAGVDGESNAAFEENLQGKPLQAVESTVLGDVLPAAGAGGGDTEEGRRIKDARGAHRGRPGGPDRGQDVPGAGRGATFPP